LDDLLSYYEQDAGRKLTEFLKTQKEPQETKAVPPPKRIGAEEMTMRNRVFRFGLSLLGVGVMAICSILIYGHGLEDTLPFILYFAAWITIPAGLLFCLTGIVLARRKGQA
jgi:hypothetical protein